LGLVSVPMWPIVLSDRLGIIGLVSFYLTNHLKPRRETLKRQVAFLIFLAKMFI